mgnify:CR=1 FL=1
MPSFDTLVDLLVDPEMLYEQLIETYDPISHWELCLHFMYTLCEQKQDTSENTTNVYYKTYTDTGDAYLLDEQCFQSDIQSSERSTLSTIRDYVFFCHRHTRSIISASFQDTINDVDCLVSYSLSDVSYRMHLTERRRDTSFTVYGPKRHVYNYPIADIFTDMCQWLKQTSSRYSSSQIDTMARQGQDMLYLVTL